jgi:hypothetical protein
MNNVEVLVEDSSAIAHQYAHRRFMPNPIEHHCDVRPNQKLAP